MSKPTQDYREVQLTSVLGKDVLLFRSMVAHEQLSQPFEYHINAYSLDASLDFTKVIGTPMSVCLTLPDNRKRYFNGWVSEFSQMPSGSHRYAAYRMVLRPWLWFLSRYSNCRFFQDKTIPDILKDVFDDRGLIDYDPKKLKPAEYPKREYCVQYRETDFNFVSRRMEEEGIYYYFEHTEDGRHILKLVDDKSDHDPAPGFATIPFAASLRSSYGPPKDTVFDWVVSQSAQPSGYALNSFYFEQPSNPLYKLVEPQAKHPQVQATLYDYPGPDVYRDIANGERYAKIRLQELHAEQERIHAKTNAMGLTVGALFTLTEFPRDDQNRQYLVTGSHIKLHSDFYESNTDSDTEQGFSCEFTAQNAEVQFRPARITPKPFVQGPQTAVVVPEKGQEAEEISTDKHGRVKVRFHWNLPGNDMGGKHQQERSCWIRVSHPLAGKNWGAMAIPRIGQEVIIDFEEGDPDRPICTGRVYNGEQKPPYSLPDSKNISGVKSDSTKGGGGYNEIIMDDTKNKELIRIHAQYDMDSTVEHDDRQTVHNNRTITVNGTHTETIKKDTTIKITEGKLDQAVVKGTADYYVKGAVTEIFDSTQTTTVKQKIEISSTEDCIHISAAKEIKLTTGKSELLMKADGTIILSGQDITIIGGKTITSSAPEIAANGTKTSKIGVGTQTVTTSTAKVEVAGAAIASAAVGSHEITGAIVKIN